jgi:transglutaminase-like putative cysteine protease
MKYRNQILSALHYVAFSFFLLVSVTACQKKEFHIYSDAAYADKVEKRFEEKKSLASMRSSDLFGVFDNSLKPAEQEGLKFLYAFMPLSDLADYPGEFFLNQVRWSLAARDTFSWGETIPEDLFRHFVLPYRVNNENLDTARIVIFKELKDRIRNLGMLEAALEVNHWCHEKVTYRGSDSRTSAPLASMKTAYGRCGEESTFTVTALRAVSIPARQVYTPRWAHSDDNHAWVEFWADGKWHYMGACEPECVPDLGWFTEPARRAMLIHTKAFGDYLGTERAENREKDFALLNTLGVYAPTKEIFVRAIGPDGRPVPQARIEFQLYNYAEYYPISIKKTDEKSQTGFLTGLGDLLIWASKDNLFGYKKISVASTDTVSIELTSSPFASGYEEFDMEPPIQREPLQIANDCKDENTRRLQREDSIRGAYEKTFPTEQAVAEFSEGLGLDPDQAWSLIQKSRGNYDEIMGFLKSVPTAKLPVAISLIEAIAEKDLRDTKSEILLDHFNHYDPEQADKENGVPYLLNPRVANEMLVAYRGFLLNSFGNDQIGAFRSDPSTLESWILNNIKIDKEANYYGTPLTPVGLYNIRVSDEHSRKIFAVAVLRTCGIPARLKPGTMQAEYFLAGAWKVMTFGESMEKSAQPATLILQNDPQNPIVPQYETHYTLAKFGDGKYNTLVYGYENNVDPLKEPLSMDPGFYALVTGNRMPGGKVLSSITWFELKAGEKKNLMITLRKSDHKPEVIAKLDPSWPVALLSGKSFSWPVVSEGGQMVIAWIEPDKETSKHVFQDLATLKTEVDRLGCPFVFLIPNEKLPAGFTGDTWKNLPDQSQFGVIANLSSLEELEKATGKKLSGQFPVVIVIDAQGQVTYLSSGYKIGIGEELIKLIPGVK